MDTDFKEPWAPILDAAKCVEFERELRSEVLEGHPLFKKKC